MKSLPSTSAGTSNSADSSGGGPTSSNGVQEIEASTSGSGSAVQQQTQVFLNPASLKQCEQLFGSTCRVKVKRCDNPTPASETNPSISTTSAEKPVDLRSVNKVEVSDTETGSPSEDDEVQVLPAPPPVTSTKKKAGKKITHGKLSAHCRVCGKTLNSKYYLKIHMRKHTREMRYRCEYCGMSFWNPNTFRGHKKARNQRNGICKSRSAEWRPKGAWKCKICGKRMKQGNKYVPHMRIHRGEKPFKCEECGKAFVTRGYLAEHRRIHSGVWRFSCVFCDKGFHQNCNLFRHLRIHTKEKPYFCVVDGCGESFRYPDILKYHRRLIHLKKY